MSSSKQSVLGSPARMTRRDFLRASSAVAGVAMLAACAPVAPSNGSATEGSARTLNSHPGGRSDPPFDATTTLRSPSSA